MASANLAGFPCSIGRCSENRPWVNLRRLSFIRVEESLPRVAFLSLAPGPIFIAFPIRYHLPPLWNGQELGLGAILLHSNQGDRIYQRTDGPCHWGMISLAPKQLAAYARAVAHVDLDLAPTPELLRPTSGVATKLRRLHARACRLAETKPDIVAHKQVARALACRNVHCGYAARNFYA